MYLLFSVCAKFGAEKKIRELLSQWCELSVENENYSKYAEAPTMFKKTW